MQTVNFECGQCGKLMAVGTNLLGQQVRCPHCRQVVLAPASAPGAGEEPADAELQSPRSGEGDNLFNPSPGAGNDIPGGPSRTPPVDSPPTDTWPNPQSDAGAIPPPDLPPAAPTFPGQQEDGLPAGDGLASVSPPPEAGDWSGGGGEGAEAEAEAGGPTSRRGRRAAPVKAGPGMAVFVLIFLIPYALILTVLAVYFYFQARSVPRGFEAMPDIGGSDPGSTRKQSKIVVEGQMVADAALPARLRVALGHTIRLGDLEVTPEKVEERKVIYEYENSGISPTPSQAPALVLTLSLKNVSQDDYFHPVDPAFYRTWKATDPSKPYTFLEVGNQRFYGGACRWPPGDNPQEYIQGQPFHKVLKPGETMSTVVCTDPDNLAVLKAVRGFHGALVWRVELRRGLIRVGDREASACAVIGVEFSPQQIVPA